MATASVTNTFVTGATILAASFNTNFTDLVSFLNNSVVHRDGSKTMTGALAMGSNKITGLANGTAATDAAAFGQIPAATRVPLFYGKSGKPEVTTASTRLPIDSSFTIVKVEAGVRVAPTTSAVTFDVHKNGTTIFTTQGNRPSIAATAFVSTGGVPDVTTLADGDYLEVHVDAVDSGATAEDVTVVVWVQGA